MLRNFRKSGSSAALLVAASIILAGAANAQSKPSSPDAATLLEMLDRKTSKSRGISSPAEATALRQLIERAQKQRGLSRPERHELYKITATRPSVDLTIYFDYNSAEINAGALPKLQVLGRTLINPRLRDATFMVAGHTDAKGGGAYNLDLSNRRAQAIRRYLMERFGIVAARLIAVGYGKEQLKTPQAPFAAENRRVQVVNLADRR